MDPETTTLLTALGLGLIGFAVITLIAVIAWVANGL